METLIKIKESVQEVCGVDFEKDRSRNRDVSDARMIYGYIARQLTMNSLEEIGQAINRDHSTIIHYQKQASALIQYDREFKRLYHKCYNAIPNKTVKKEFKENINIA